MRTFKLNKLVRDKIVQFHKDMGGSVMYTALDDEAYLKALQQKLIEEVSEIKSADPEEVLKELGDLQEVIDSMALAIGKTKADVENAQATKAQKSGSFKERLFIETVTLPDDEYWAHYYAKDPKRFPEITDKVRKNL